jgi:regulator of sirC expression with transglutaminase-like and TPR domain
MLDSSANRLGTALGNRSSSPAAVDSIVSLVYGRWRIGFDDRDSLAETLLPHLVYRNKKGECLGTGLILLMLAERIGCPLFGVVLPGHFFLRYDNGAERFNVEPNRAGFRHPDEYYRTRYPVADMPWYDLGNLTKFQTAGMLCYNTGVLCINKNKNRAALFLFSQTSHRFPMFTEGQGNLALAYYHTGHSDSALLVFRKLFGLYPCMENLAMNYGTVALSAKKYREAAAVFRKGLTCTPKNSALIRGLSQACGHAGACDSGQTE